MILLLLRGGFSSCKVENLFFFTFRFWTVNLLGKQIVESHLEEKNQISELLIKFHFMMKS